MWVGGGGVCMSEGDLTVYLASPVICKNHEL